MKGDRKMEGARWEILVRIMGRLAGGDQAAVFELYEEFGGHIAAAVRRLAGSMGVTLGADEVDGLVLDACMALMDAAPSWDPNGGALPWTWAEKRLRHIVAVQIGIHTEPMDEHDEGEGSAVLPVTYVTSRDRDDDPVRTLNTLAEFHPDAREFRAALEMVASPRDQRIFLEVVVQNMLGDQAPAGTVGRLLGLKPATVRQIVKRVRDRLRAAGIETAA